MRMMTRWRKYMGTATLIAGATGLSGCTKPLYITPETQQLASTVGLPPNLATDPGAASLPDVSNHKAPPTIHDSNREPRYISLQEAMAIGLERGTTGNDFSWLGTEDVPQQENGGGGWNSRGYSEALSSGRGQQDDAIRAFALDPAIVDADVEGALAKFDARFQTSMSWQKKDQAVANIFNNFNNGDFAAFSAGLVKPLPTGGTAGITFENNYSRLSNVPSGFSVINPSYSPTMTLGLEQPLLRDYGVDINQLLPQHPGATQSQFQTFRANGGRQEGILVTRLRADQAKAEFERHLYSLVFNVELAYWQLYGRYYAKYAAEQALKLSYTTWEQLQQLQTAGLQTKQGVAQARAQFEGARISYAGILQQVLDAERRFRGILGLPLEDGTRLVPADTAILAPYKPDWTTSLAETMANRPELRTIRQELKIQQLNVMLQQNNVRPDLRFFANYSMNGIGNRLDGPGPVTTVNDQLQENTTPGNALANFADNKFGSWNTGIRLDVPLGNRDAHANLKVAQLNLARSHIVLKNQEKKAEFILAEIYAKMITYHEQIQLFQGRRIALGTQLQGQFERVKIGKDPLIQLLDAQRDFARSIESEANVVTSYNISIAAFHAAKGTILQYNNITIGDGPLPAAIGERAADHFAARQAGLKVRERPALPPTTPTATLGVLPAGVLPEATGTPKIDPDAPPPLSTMPGAPLVIPPTIPAGPKDPPAPMPPMTPTPPKDGKAAPKTIPLVTPGPLPNLKGPDIVSTGPALPVAGSEPAEMPALPSTPVSKYRPK